MNKELFKKGVRAIAEHVEETLKNEIIDQVETIAVGDDNDEALCNLNSVISHLRIVDLFLWWVENEEYADKETFDGMYLILYEEPYYDFDVIEIVEDYDDEIDANEFNRVLISYLKRECSIDDLDDDNEKND